MVNHELLAADGILILPESSLKPADFERIAAEVDLYIEANGKLHGLMIEAPGFPQWDRRPQAADAIM